MKRGAYLGRSTACRPSDIILKSPMAEKTRHRNGDTDDIIETILAMDADSDRWVNAESAKCLRGATLHDTLHNVWAIVKRNNTYRADRPGHERVKSPGALFASGYGDCKSFSIAEGALLRAFGIRYKYRFAAYAPGDYTHVYVVAATPQGWVPLDAVHDAPFEEVRYWKKKDIAPKNSGIAGCPPTGGCRFSCNEIALLGLLLITLFRR